MKKKLLNGLLFTALAGASQISAAALTGAQTVTINFPGSNMGAASYGYGTNANPVDISGVCPTTGGSDCYYEDGFAIGSPTTSNITNHIHRVGSITGGGLLDKALAYHADSTGIYLRALDGSAFNLMSMVFKAPIYYDEATGDGNFIYGAAADPNNPLSGDPADIGLQGPQEKWQILGFSSAFNPTTNSASINALGASAIAQASVANGFTGSLGTAVSGANTFLLGDAFKNISALWIHYNGYSDVPLDGIQFEVKVDNIVLGAPTAVPVPGAVWLFGTGMLGLFSFGRKKAALTA